MKKIPSLFVRDFEGDRRTVRDEVTPGCEWVTAGEGIATRKWDGTACMVRDGVLYKRYDAKAFTVAPDGSHQPYRRQPPVGFEPCQDPDPVTGHWPGWVPVGGGPENRWYHEAWAEHMASTGGDPLGDGTYELCGPKIGGDPEGFCKHVLIAHGCVVLEFAPRDYLGLTDYFSDHPMEGIVWHHPDGRMAKIKARDFGIPWPRKVSAE